MERGKALADYILALLDAYEKATTRRRVVSAFGQAGIFDKTPNPTSPKPGSPTSARVRPVPCGTTLGFFGTSIPLDEIGGSISAFRI